MTPLIVYRTAVAADWIDYNGHVRDAYYGLIISYGVDALMDRIGMDAPYRRRTGNTLFTVEMHIHFLREIKQSDTVEVAVRVLGLDRKRLHVAVDLLRVGAAEPAATSEQLLLHVNQEAKTAVVPFAPEVQAAIEELAQATATAPPLGPGSRQIRLHSR